MLRKNKVKLANSPFEFSITSLKNCNRWLRQGHGTFVNGEFYFNEPFRQSAILTDLGIDKTEIARVTGNKSSGVTRFKVNDKKGPTPEELHWRESVLLRDGYKCVWCGSTEELQGDHIKPKAVYPDLKYDIANGRTLCGSCHRQTDTYGRKSAGIVTVEYA